MIVILTSGSICSIHGRAFPPHGNPLVYSLAISWLISITIAFVSSAIFFRVKPALFSLANWEKQGEIYNRAGIRTFRWVLFHSPLGWINPNFHLRAGRVDCDRLLRELNSSEAVHWLTCLGSVTLAISYLRHDHAVYGYVMLLVRIPFDLYPIMLQRRNRGRIRRVLARPAHKIQQAAFPGDGVAERPILMDGRFVGMKSLFDATVANQVQTRLGKLTPLSERQWGKMTAPQMLAHCSLSMQWALGEVVPDKGPLPIRLIGRLVKPLVFRNEDPLRRNSPTAKSLVIADERDLDKERMRLSGLITKFAAGGAAACTNNPHSFFGKMTPDQWAMLMFKHLDHHLRQFGV